MSFDQIGKYIKLLCIQHQKGHLSEKDMLNICQTYDKDIFSKFDKDSDGLYFNKRLDIEINRRREYCNSRRKNRLKENNISETYVKHMETETETIIIKEKEKKKFTPPTLDEVKIYFEENGYRPELAENIFKGYAVANWHDSNDKQIKNWKQKMHQVWFKDENRVNKTETNGLSKPKGVTIPE